ncbi:MAG: GDSL-type esterase/lipase family protein [Thermoanaerobaculia bacterium]
MERTAPRGNRFSRFPRLTLLLVAALVLLAGLVLLELLVRSAAVDFYAPELARGTPQPGPGGPPLPTLLALGDSFTANPDGWVSRLRSALGPGWRVVGSGVSGFTTRQIARIAPGRVARFAPRVVVVQLYAGNDLLELRHPVRWRSAHVVRNLFWTLSDAGFESPGLLNYRAGQAAGALLRRLGAAPLPEGGRLALESRPFDPSLYNARDRDLLALDPSVVERQLRLSGGMEQAFEAYAAHLRSILAACRRGGARVVVFVVPHAVEVDPAWVARFEALGARFERPGALAEPESPFGLAVRRVVATEEGAAFLDVKPALRAAEAAGRGVYRNNDPHFSPEGDRVLAALLLDELARSGFVAESPRQQ